MSDPVDVDRCEHDFTPVEVSHAPYEGWVVVVCRKCYGRKSLVSEDLNVDKATRERRRARLWYNP